MSSHNDHSIVLTEAALGIGRAIAILFAIEGAKGVSLNYLPKEEKDAEDVKAYM